MIGKVLEYPFDTVKVIYKVSFSFETKGKKTGFNEMTDDRSKGKLILCVRRLGYSHSPMNGRCDIAVLLIASSRVSGRMV